MIFLQIYGDADEDEIFSHLATIFDNKFVSSDLGIVILLENKYLWTFLWLTLGSD